MAGALELHPDRLFLAEPVRLASVRSRHAGVAAFTVVSLRSHADPTVFADDANFTKATSLLLMTTIECSTARVSLAVKHRLATGKPLSWRTNP
jgi:glucuronate isomerase